MERIISDVLDCNGPGFDAAWRGLFDASAAQDASGTGPFSAPRKLFEVANETLKRWRPRVNDALWHLPGVMVGKSHSRVLRGFCAQGFMTALFWECFDVGPATSSSVVTTCLQGLTSGLLDTPNWGPLEFSQSARWPVKVLDIRLLLEHWSGCQHYSVSECPDISVSQLRRGLQLNHNDYSTLVGWDSIRKQMEIDSFEPELEVRRKSATEEIKMVVVGSHLGSNMEPLSIVVAAMQRLSLRIDAVVYGTLYPFPEIACELFGHCSKNPHIDEVVALLVRQMYRAQWEPLDLMNRLSAAFQNDQILRAAEIILCAQPMPLCSMLRPLTDLPMLIYQAFPLIGATPAALRHMILMHFREMAQLPRRSVFIAYSEFLAAQFSYQMGQRPLCIRPHSLYATQGGLYNPDRENPRILVSRVAGWARDSAGALVHFIEALAERDLRPGSRIRFIFLGVNREPSDTVAGLAQPFGYRELRRYRAAVFFPWDMGMLLFSELYSMGVPLFLPDRSWAAAIIKRMLEYTDFGWWQARYNTATTLPNAPALGDAPWPWLDPNSTIKEILDLYDQTDFVRWPHVEGFSGLPDLVARLLDFNFDATSDAMQTWNSRALPHSLSIISRAVSSILDESIPLPSAGESSCV